MIRVTVIGFGKTGALVAQLAPLFNIGIACVVDRSYDERIIPPTCRAFKTLCMEAVNLSDIAIDFSSSAGILSRIELFAKAKKPMIIGTTGWDRDKEKAKALIEKHDSALLFSPNFSLGVALFMLLAKQASALMHNFPAYDVGILETHHRQKQDAPSGTACLLGKIVSEQYPEKTLYYDTPRDKALEKNAIHVSAHRVGSVPGTHELVFDSDTDTICLKHASRNREGYAKGALEAAFWLIDKKGWYTLEDMVQDKLKRSL